MTRFLRHVFSLSSQPQLRTPLIHRLTLLGLVACAADARKPSIGIEYLIDGSTVSQWRQRGSRPTIGCAHVVADRNVCQIVAHLGGASDVAFSTEIASVRLMY